MLYVARQCRWIITQLIVNNIPYVVDLADFHFLADLGDR